MADLPPVITLPEPGEETVEVPKKAEVKEEKDHMQVRIEEVQGPLRSRGHWGPLKGEWSGLVVTLDGEHETDGEMINFMINFISIKKV